MPTVSSHPPGTFCWIELATSDASAGKQFYRGLFGWTVQEHPMGEMGTYFIFRKDDRDVAAMYQIGPQQPGMPPNWMSYIAVADADESAAKAKSLGGTVHAGPFDVAGNGRMAVLSDPQGAMFAIWQAREHAGVRVRDEANALCWNELAARDIEGSKAFYTALFGWRMKESDEYTEWHIGQQAIGGMLPSQAPDHVPPHWLPYFAVGDCDAAVGRAGELGGRTIVAPMDIPNVGRFAVVADPAGAPFAVIRLMM